MNLDKKKIIIISVLVGALIVLSVMLVVVLETQNQENQPEPPEITVGNYQYWFEEPKDFKTPVEETKPTDFEISQHPNINK